MRPIHRCPENFRDSLQGRRQPKSRRGALSIVRGTSCQRHENRDAEGVEEGGSGEGVSPSPVGEESGEGAVSPPQKICYFFHSK